jgi:hypothetical protein
MAPPIRFPIRFDAGYAVLSTALLIFPSDSYVAIEGSVVSARMGWAFRTRFDASCVARASGLGKRVLLTRGVHGFAGRWLVNGSGDGIVKIELEPRQRAYVMGFPVQLRELQVSVDDPAALTAALAGARQRALSAWTPAGA